MIYSGSRSVKKVALTFDDGPDKVYTQKILDILQENKVKATFFVLGAHAEKYPEMVKRMAKEGHVVGNHSWDHANLTKLSGDELIDEVERADRTIEKLTGSYPALFRAPYGEVSKELFDVVEKTPNRSVIGWSVDTRDWEKVSADKILATVKKETKPGAILLEHCAGGKGGDLSNTIQALPKIIAYLKSEGYSFVTVPELLNPT
ncbi:polysaccharide deacetylase family protein [Paenibacillus thalictri]|uniref:Polysaccharide deacetylase family protein n=1 Tax=Paenibacillus thalictri TaxID=2527873 RepID=A0A4Q9DR70_9BACL|nr:polysaccharide deacetylase family protein [Paenibacillus thalictri]